MICSSSIDIDCKLIYSEMILMSSYKNAFISTSIAAASLVLISSIRGPLTLTRVKISSSSLFLESQSFYYGNLSSSVLALNWLTRRTLTHSKTWPRHILITLLLEGPDREYWEKDLNKLTSLFKPPLDKNFGNQFFLYSVSSEVLAIPWSRWRKNFNSSPFSDFLLTLFWLGAPIEAAALGGATGAFGFV
jgi:hypothetical protein